MGTIRHLVGVIVNSHSLLDLLRGEMHGQAVGGDRVVPRELGSGEIADYLALADLGVEDAKLGAIPN